MGCWNTTNYGGRHTLDLNEMGHIWQNYYLKNIKDLTDAQARTMDDEEKVNINAAVRIYRVYLMSHLTDIYGDVPYFEAFDGTKDRITGDVIYNGDINKWKKFANSLRLRYAMRISDANPQKAQEEFEKALAADGGIIASGADDALI